MIDVSVCVPVYKSHPEPNLTTLAAGLEEALDELQGELVVALNGISAEAARVPDGARTVDLGVNRGVAPAWNAAARAAVGAVLVFANDDLLLGAQSVRRLYEALERLDDAGVVGPVGTDWERWEVRSATDAEWTDLSHDPPGESRVCAAVSGYLFACRRETYERAGGFDEFYAPCSFEEVDFYTNVRRRLGLRCYAVAGIAHTHEWAISRPAMPWQRVRYDGRSETLRSIHRRNRRHYAEKWAPGLTVPS